MKKLTNTETAITSGGFECICAWEESLNEDMIAAKIKSSTFSILYSSLKYLNMYHPREQKFANQAPGGGETSCKTMCCKKKPLHLNEKYVYKDIEHDCD